MCGRFTQRTPAHLIYEYFAIPGEPLQLALRFNIAPTQNIATVRLDEQSNRELAMLHWGLIPSWADDAKIGNRMINARAEGIAEKPSFRAAFKRRRCLIVADGYYEWKKADSPKGQKQPYLFHMRDDQPFAFAGLWERNEKLGEPIESCTIITTEPNALAAEVHDRMPVILEPDNYDLWLDPEFEGYEQLQSLLKPYDGDDLIATPVSNLVNSPRNDSPECVQRVR